MTPEEKLAIAAASTNMLLEHLSEFSVRILDTTDSDDQTKWNLFSGTLIQFGNRLLVATVSHSLKELRSPSRYWVLGNKPSRKSDCSSQVIATYMDSNSRPDVGIIELDPSLLSCFHSGEGLPLSRIKCDRTGREDRPVILYGSPRVNAKVESHDEATTIKIENFGYTSQAIEHGEWPSFNADPSLDEKTDIMMHYPSGKKDVIRTDTGKEIELPNPKGMSGGGLWDQGFGIGNDVWSCEDAFLFGIQSAWFERKRYVRAVQIHHWLNLVCKKLPELRGEIETVP